LDVNKQQAYSSAYYSADIFLEVVKKGDFFFHFNLDCAITLSYQEIVIFIYLFHQKSNEYGHEHLILNS